MIPAAPANGIYILQLIYYFRTPVPYYFNQKRVTATQGSQQLLSICFTTTMFCPLILSPKNVTYLHLISMSNKL